MVDVDVSVGKGYATEAGDKGLGRIVDVDVNVGKGCATGATSKVIASRLRAALPAAAWATTRKDRT